MFIEHPLASSGSANQYIALEDLTADATQLALGLVARTVKKNRQLGLTVLKQGAVHLQTKNVVVYI